MDANTANFVPVEDACPRCGERDADRLVWRERPREGLVHCINCGALYEPGGAEGASDE